MTSKQKGGLLAAGALLVLVFGLYVGQASIKLALNNTTQLAQTSGPAGSNPPAQTVPSIPSKVKVESVAVTDGSFLLSKSAPNLHAIWVIWQGNNPSGTRFDIYRTTDPNWSSSSVIGSTTATGNQYYTFADTTAGPLKSYYYCVAAVNSMGYSKCSNVSSTELYTGAFPAPTDLRGAVLASSTPKKISIVWNDTSSTETSFEIFCTTNLANANWPRCGEVPANTTSFTTSQLYSGGALPVSGTVYYMVRAKDVNSYTSNYPLYSNYSNVIGIPVQ